MGMFFEVRTVLDKKSQGITQVISIHPEGKCVCVPNARMDWCTQFHG